MRKILFLLSALLGTAGAWAGNVTDRSSAGEPMTFAEFQALAGTGKHFAIVGVSDNTQFCYPNWFGFTATFGSSMTPAYLFDLEGSATGDGWYNIRRVSDGQYVSTEGGNFATTPKMDFALVNRTPGDYHNSFSATNFISLDNAAGNHYNCNISNLGFRGGTGGYSAYAAYGPFYVVTVNCVNSSTNETFQTLTYVVTDGTTVNAPNIASYALDTNVSVTVNGADAIMTANYAPIVFDPNDVAGKTFTMQCARGYVYYNGSQLAGTSTAASASEFAIVSYDNNTYLYDVTNNAFVCHSTAATAGTTGNAALESSDDFSKIVKNISFGTTNIAAYPYYVQEDEFTNWLNMDGGPRVYFNRWTNFENGNGGNTYNIAVVDIDFDQTAAAEMLENYFNPSATVKYVISDADGVVLQTEPVPATVGETITALPSEFQRAFCTYSAINSPLVAGENTINVTVSYNLPFETGTDKLYYAKLRNHYVYYDATNTDVRANQTSKENTNAYRWSFYGNPYSGIKVKNAETGTYLDNTSSTVQLSAEGYGWTISRLSETSTFGLFNGSNYINESNQGNHNLIYWWNFTTDAGSQWEVEEVPDVVVTVTYELYVDGEIVKTVIVEEVAANSAVSVPASLTENYSTLGYDFVTSGTIGEENCTIIVAGTLKANVIENLANLDNTKAYTLSTERGALYIKNDHLASNYNDNAGATAGKFAILSYEDNYYLYSVDASKFVLGDGSLSETPTADIETLGLTAQTIKPLFLGKLGSNGLNVTNTEDNYELVINTWVTADAGNRYCIAEAEDFDAATAIAALEEYFHPAAETLFNEAIAALQAIDFGSGLGQYSLTGENAGYTTLANDIVDGLEAEGYTEENLERAQAMLANYALNMPTGKFIRLYSEARGAYWGTAASGKHPNVTNVDDAGIYYVASDGKVLSMDQAAYLQNAAGAPCTTEDNAGIFEFADAGNGKYYVKCGGYMVSWTSATDRLQSPGEDGYAVWTITEVEDYDYTLTVGETGYATLSFPVALTIPTGVTAYTAEIAYEGTYKYLNLSKISDVIPAKTAVVLMADADDYTFAPTTSEAFKGTNALQAALGKRTVADGNYVLAKPEGKNVGFYLADSGTPLSGFKAYLVDSGSSYVNGFTFFFEDEDPTGINAVNGEGFMVNGPIYNLAGQRIQKMQKGINIVNGKKILF